MDIELRNITKRHGSFTALEDVSLHVKSGELVALLGPSGSGKTTLLRIIAGLDAGDVGEVLLGGVAQKNPSGKERNVGFVFQHYALFKHMSVFRNVAFGLEVRPASIRPTREEIRRKVTELLQLVHLDAFADRYPSQLSGGQRQRVALARALAVEPKLLLLDEPFGALDAKVRLELRRWMRRLHDELQITSVFVTHDQEEAMEVADRVVVMSAGRIEQIGTPEEVWQTPVNAFVYDFLGNYNEFEGWQDEKGVNHLADADVEAKSTAPPNPSLAPKTFFSRYPLLGTLFGKRQKQPLLMPRQPRPARKFGKGRPVRLFARPHEMFVSRELEGEAIGAVIVHINPAGSLVKLELEREDGGLLQAEIPKEAQAKMQLKRNERVYVRPKHVKAFEIVDMPVAD